MMLPSFPSYGGYSGAYPAQYPAIPRVNSRYGIPMSPRNSYVPPVSSPRTQSFYSYAAPLVRQQSSYSYAAPLVRQQSAVRINPPVYATPRAASPVMTMPRSMSYVAPVAIQRTPSMVRMASPPRFAFTPSMPMGGATPSMPSVPMASAGFSQYATQGSPSYTPPLYPTSQYTAPQGSPVPSYTPPMYPNYGTRGVPGEVADDAMDFAPPMKPPKRKRGSCP